MLNKMGPNAGIATLAIPMRHSPAVDIVLKPELVANFEFLEWTLNGQLRRSKFVGLRDDQRPPAVGREA
jgi:ATP-dependent DNA ligase